jgi:hypothetical protein
VCYSDADYGGDKDNGKSTGGYVIKVGTGAISWSSKLQSVVTLSTTEEEYIAAVEAGKEMIWTCNILSEFGYKVDGASIMKMDNQSVISVSVRVHLSISLPYLLYSLLSPPTLSTPTSLCTYVHIITKG